MHGLWSLGTPGSVSLVPMSPTKSASTMGLFSDVNSRFPSIKNQVKSLNTKVPSNTSLARRITKGRPNWSPILPGESQRDGQIGPQLLFRYSEEFPRLGIGMPSSM
jgi:hypothetical protein